MFLHIAIPDITAPKMEVHTITDGDSIACTATGYPEPNIVWLNSSESEVNEDRLMPGSPTATGIGDLISMSVSLIVRGGDDGVYICVARNSVGNDSYTISITVQCKL